MKLLLCLNCDDIFNLDYALKACTCGTVKGKYIDNRNAVYCGESAIPLGFDNYSFASAIRSQKDKSLFGERFISFVIPKQCLTFSKVNELN